MKKRDAQERVVAIALGLDKTLPWHHGIYAGTQQYALEQPGWRCVIDEFPQNILREEAGGRPRYSGIIARVSRPLYLCAKQMGIPLVNVWQNSPVKKVPTVSTHRERGGRQIAEHLLDRGLQRFGYISAEGRLAESIEREFFCKQIEEAGFSASCLTVVSAPNLTADYWSDLNRSIDNWLSSMVPPFGVAVAFPNAARILVHLCENRGLRVPLDVAIICTSASKAICESPPPALSSLDYNWELLGYEAAKTLDAMMAGDPPPTRDILVPPKGVIRVRPLISWRPKAA